MFAGKVGTREFYSELCSQVCRSVSNDRRCQGDTCGGGADPEQQKNALEAGSQLPLGPQNLSGWTAPESLSQKGVQKGHPHTCQAQCSLRSHREWGTARSGTRRRVWEQPGTPGPEEEGPGGKRCSPSRRDAVKEVASPRMGLPP